MRCLPILLSSSAFAIDYKTAKQGQWKSLGHLAVVIVHWIRSLLCAAVIIIQLIARRKREGESKQLCLMPVFTWKLQVIPS